MGDEAREISRVGVGYLGGSFLELRAVTTRNRALETNEVQAAVQRVSVLHWYFAFKYKHRSFLKLVWQSVCTYKAFFFITFL